MPNDPEGRETVPPSIDTILALPRDVRVDEIADTCREEVLRFVNETRDGSWTKLELALWLTGPYERITGPATRVLLERTGEAPQSGPSLHVAASPSTVRRIIEVARSEVIAVIDCLRSDEMGASFALSALSGGLVAPCEDECGARGWLPVSRSNMSLTDRLLSLLAVDYLKRPDAHEHVRVCEVCENVCFDEVCTHAVRSHGPQSGFASHESEAPETSREVA
jgi:hypothetical protein